MRYSSNPTINVAQRAILSQIAADTERFGGPKNATVTSETYVANLVKFIDRTVPGLPPANEDVFDALTGALMGSSQYSIEKMVELLWVASGPSTAEVAQTAAFLFKGLLWGINNGVDEDDWWQRSYGEIELFDQCYTLAEKIEIAYRCLTQGERDLIDDQVWQYDIVEALGVNCAGWQDRHMLADHHEQDEVTDWVRGYILDNFGPEDDSPEGGDDDGPDGPDGPTDEDHARWAQEAYQREIDGIVDADAQAQIDRAEEAYFADQADQAVAGCCGSSSSGASAANPNEPEYLSYLPGERLQLYCKFCGGVEEHQTTPLVYDSQCLTCGTIRPTGTGYSEWALEDMKPIAGCTKVILPIVDGGGVREVEVEIQRVGFDLTYGRWVGVEVAGVDGLVQVDMSGLRYDNDRRAYVLR